MRKVIISFCLLLLVLLAVFPALGQDAPGGSDPVVGTPISDDPVTSDQVFGLDKDTVFMLVAVFGITIVSAVGAFQSVRATGNFLSAFERLNQGVIEITGRKDVRDQAERRYVEGSISYRHLIELFRAGFVFIGNSNIGLIDPAVDSIADFLKDTTDGNQNEETPVGDPLPEHAET